MRLVAFSRTVVTFLYTLASMKTYILRVHTRDRHRTLECPLNIEQITYGAYILSLSLSLFVLALGSVKPLACTRADLCIFAARMRYRVYS